MKARSYTNAFVKSVAATTFKQRDMLGLNSSKRHLGQWPSYSYKAGHNLVRLTTKFDIPMVLSARNELGKLRIDVNKCLEELNRFTKLFDTSTSG